MQNLPVPAGGPLTNVNASFDASFASAAEYAKADRADATRKAYRRDFEDFGRWCGAHGAQPLPAAVETVCAYLAHLADSGLKVSTITRRAAAISYAHRSLGCPPPTASDPVKRVLKGIRRRTGVAVAAKAPATARAISQMLRRIPDSLAGKRDRALLLLGFAAALRRSELVALTVADLERTPDGLLVRIAKSKTDQEGAGHVVAVPRGSKLRPVEAVDAWLAAASIVDGPVFRSVGKGGRVSVDALSAQSVALIVKEYVAAAKLDPKLFAGHSLRAGFVTSALEAGADLLRVMDVTRHKSVDTLRIYDRRAQAFKNHAGGKFL